MKTIKHIIFALPVLAMFAVSSCAKADPEAIHTDNTIQAISIYRIANANGNKEGDLAGIINEELGEIYFKIPSRAMVIWEEETENLTKVKIQAKVGWDVSITPSLSGQHDLSQPMTITVKSGTGTTRTYTLFVEEEL